MEMSIGNMYLKLIDLSYYKRTGTMIANDKPFEYYKAALCVEFLPMRIIQPARGLNIKELTSWGCFPKNLLDDIKMIWENETGLLMYLKHENYILRSMAEIKNKLVADEKIEVTIKIPNKKFCLTEEEWNKGTEELYNNTNNIGNYGSSPEARALSLRARLIKAHEGQNMDL